jgi:uroporphyrinogen-III decarboxylase
VAYIIERVESVSRVMPGRLWRIYGPEYVAPPFLPVSFFQEYVVRYDKPIIDIIHQNKGFARVHAHGKVKEIMPDIIAMKADAIDPLEPPEQGDIELSDARKQYGEQLVLFGNIEVADIENMPSARFRPLVKKTISDGTSGCGRGFVLMPSSSPFGREINNLTMDNYKIMIEEIEKLS